MGDQRSDIEAVQPVPPLRGLLISSKVAEAPTDCRRSYKPKRHSASTSLCRLQKSAKLPPTRYALLEQYDRWSDTIGPATYLLWAEPGGGGGPVRSRRSRRASRSHGSAALARRGPPGGPLDQHHAHRNARRRLGPPSQLSRTSTVPPSAGSSSYDNAQQPNDRSAQRASSPRPGMQLIERERFASHAEARLAIFAFIGGTTRSADTPLPGLPRPTALRKTT